MHKTALAFFAASALFGTFGMGWGLQMSMAQDFTLSAAHAHLNLTGFLTLAVYGAFYALHTEAAGRFLARIHCAIAVISVIVFAPGIALAVTGNGGTVAMVGGMLVIASMLIFLGTVLSCLFERSPYRQHALN